ncbi:porin [Burkholderia cepacia]|uniref:porin n=1 Tax=Burkholderia cepacia TaxID=292 RepID=UPI002AB678D4|nr:porin [Burkholderia cepacia]
MRKLAYCSVPLALLGFACASYAQSSVTLYGLIDSGLVYTSNAGGHSSLQQGSVMAGSRWGLIGSEDLGNGLKAIFTLENGFNPANGKLGQNGRMFGRQAFVGLSDNRFGSLTLGRQYMPNYTAPQSLTGTLSGGGAAAHPYDNDDLTYSLRNNNSVVYQSSNLGGFRFGAQYGFSNATNFADSRSYSFSAAYGFGGLTLSSFYFQVNNEGSTTNPNGTVASGDAAFNAGRHRSWGAGAGYVFGSSTVNVLFTQTQLSNATAIGAFAAGASNNVPLTNPSARFTNYELNYRYLITPAFSLAGAYTFTDGQLDGVRPKYHQVTVNATYSLSKRTDLYAEAIYQHVTGAGNSGITAAIYNASRSSGNSQTVATVGMRHRF